MNIVRKSFRPEFLNRVDEFIIFRNLDKDDIVKIVDIQLINLIKRLEEQEYSIHFSDDVKSFLAEKGYDPDYGARPLKRVIQSLVENPLAVQIVEGNFMPGYDIYVELDRKKDGGIIFETKK